MPTVLAFVQVELAAQILLCPKDVLVVGLRSEELALAVRATCQSRRLVYALQDDQAAF
jgi:hypothetical protein